MMTKRAEWCPVTCVLGAPTLGLCVALARACVATTSSSCMCLVLQQCLTGSVVPSPAIGCMERWLGAEC